MHWGICGAPAGFDGINCPSGRSDSGCIGSFIGSFIGCISFGCPCNFSVRGVRSDCGGTCRMPGQRARQWL
jgi:hypothetical protein